MQIFFNGEQETLTGEKTVADLLAKFDLNPNIVTVELNGEILDKSLLASTALKEGDKVEVLMFMGGGQ